MHGAMQMCAQCSLCTVAAHANHVAVLVSNVEDLP